MSVDDAAFRDFVHGSQHRLVNFAMFLVGDLGRAEDLVQDAYLKAYLKWSRISDRAPEAYVRRCILNGRTDWWRRRSSRERPARAPGSAQNSDPSDAVAVVDQRLVVLEALRRLTERERAVTVLRHYLGLTESEIAAELGIASGTVKSTASRAADKLRADQILREGAGYERRP